SAESVDSGAAQSRPHPESPEACHFFVQPACPRSSLLGPQAGESARQGPLASRSPPCHVANPSSPLFRYAFPLLSLRTAIDAVFLRPHVPALDPLHILCAQSHWSVEPLPSGCDPQLATALAE